MMALGKYVAWIFIRPVIHAEHDDRAHLRPQRIGRTAPLRRARHPHHVAMRTIGDEAVEPRFGLGHGVGLGEANGIEAARTRLFDQRGLDRGGVAQKSRSA
jgi:hypothetical protein